MLISSCRSNFFLQNNNKENFNTCRDYNSGNLQGQKGLLQLWFFSFCVQCRSLSRQLKRMIEERLDRVVVPVQFIWPVLIAGRRPALAFLQICQLRTINKTSKSMAFCRIPTIDRQPTASISVIQGPQVFTLPITC